LSQEPGLTDAFASAGTLPPVLGPAAEAELAAALRHLGPLAEQLGTRAPVAQYEADLGVPERTRHGTSLAGTTGPLPRFLPVRDVLRISFNIHELTPAEAVPTRHARSPRTPTDDNLTFTMPYAPSLRDALDLVARYGDAVLPWYSRWIEVSGNTLRMTYNPAVPIGRIEPLATEVALATIHRIVETFVGPRIGEARVHFARASVSTADTLAERFSCPISYGGSDSYMDMPRAWAKLPSPYHDASLWLEGLARCEADIRMLQEPPLAARVRAHIGAVLDSGRVVTLAASARTLGVSSRSLVRALAKAGVTHHQLVEAERRMRTERLLAEPNLPLADVAERLGFTDLSSFGRKCRAWYGLSPSRVRRQLVGAATG
jgi:AraC-like DNA-binding protein